MKRPFYILLAGVVAVGLILFFRPKPPAANEPIVTPKSLYTNTATALKITNSSSAEITTQVSAPTVTSVEPKKILDAIKAQSIADWTNAVPNLKVWNHFRSESSWVAVQKDTNNYPVLLLGGMNGNTVQFAAKLIDVETVDVHIRRVELHTPNMSINQTRKLGESLLEMMGKDKSSFDAWCDRVGNNWVDAPLFGSGSSQVPDSNKFYGFQMLRSYGNEKPWVINFIITDK